MSNPIKRWWCLRDERGLGHVWWSAETGAWWSHVGEATQYASEAEVAEVAVALGINGVPGVTICDVREEVGPEDMTDGREEHDPDAGEGWKKS